MRVIPVPPAVIATLSPYQARENRGIDNGFDSKHGSGRETRSTRAASLGCEGRAHEAASSGERCQEPRPDSRRDAVDSASLAERANVSQTYISQIEKNADRNFGSSLAAQKCPQPR